MIKLSYSRLTDYLNCKRKYWWKYVRKLELKHVNVNFVVGTYVHEGVGKLFAKEPNAIETVLADLQIKVDELRMSFSLSAEKEQRLVETEAVVRGMLNAYRDNYADIIAVTEHFHNELEERWEFSPEVFLELHVDNIIKSDDIMYIHELKTTKSIDEAYVRAIMCNFQSAIYFHALRTIRKDLNIQGIIFDVIQKPSIRQKKNETYNQYLERLATYYETKPPMEVFYMEIIKYPLKGYHRILNQLEVLGKEVTKLNKEGNPKELYYCNDTYCYLHSKCDFFDVCHHGETPNVMVNYKPREEMR